MVREGFRASVLVALLRDAAQGLEESLLILSMGVSENSIHVERGLLKIDELYDKMTITADPTS